MCGEAAFCPFLLMDKDRICKEIQEVGTLSVSQCHHLCFLAATARLWESKLLF